MDLDPWLLQHLVCPRDHQPLIVQADDLVCGAGHQYPVVAGVPVMLVAEAPSTHAYIEKSLAAVREYRDHGVPLPWSSGPVEMGAIDAFVQGELPYTCGHLYFASQYRLTRYPIPHLDVPDGRGSRLLDVGCNWGRWTIAAARRGYHAVGIDPSLEAVIAARRVSRQLGVNAVFVVGDARFLPFAEDSFDVGFSYGVFHHLSKDTVRVALAELHRVVKSNGLTVVQIANQAGPRARYQRWRRGYTEGEGFEVRYWTPAELISLWTTAIGTTTMTADSYFGLGIQRADADLVAARYRPVTYASAALVRLSRVVRPLVRWADSVYLRSTNLKN
jgi:ubiquinone/menaquinone biosynthesis C-methylase UbiE/uncharacterized protein YbaR (Trm112 family)